MKTFRLFGVLVCLSFAMNSFAERVCPDGVEKHIMYGFYCAETSPEAYQQASLQLTILRLQNPNELIYFKTLSTILFEDEICIYVEFVRCVKYPKEFQTQSGKNAFEVNAAVAGLEKMGFEIHDVQTHQDGRAEAYVTSPEGESLTISIGWPGLETPGLQEQK